MKALLNASSPLHAAFPDGVFPLAKATTVTATLGDDKLPQQVWLLDVKKCTIVQLLGLAEVMAAAGQGTKDEITDYLAGVKELPIRTLHVSAVELGDLRQFL